MSPALGAFADQLPLELGQRREDAEHEAAGGSGGVDLRALPAPWDLLGARASTLLSYLERPEVVAVRVGSLVLEKVHTVG